ncbi:glutamyl-tRNA reductase [Pseudomonadales bacterium]|jgi:glutamyl-tRNA reductase|nr:glutamyl-tRNA reductase [Pseudomonadales bacterium]MDB4631494.1 glutamyl-tRNA reductase [Pseudomonadales bacterium]
MQLMAIGINYATASVALREKLAIAPEAQAAAVVELAAQLTAAAGDSTGEALILSTCNRTEIVVGGLQVESVVLEWLATYCGVARAEFIEHVYTHRGRDALNHLIRVASGLDSMVLGEPQIFGQMKSAFAVSRGVNALGAELGPALEHVFAVAKKVRSGTAIGENPVSVAYAAVAMAQRLFSELAQARVLLVGAGATIELVAKHMRDAGADQITVANRTLEKAHILASALGSRAMLLAELPENLSDFDIVITSTASQLPIIGKGMVEQAMKARKHKPMFMVDIAVPRDIEPQVAELPDAYLYSVDDLKGIIDQNVKLRQEEAGKAQEIIAGGVEQYQSWVRSRDASDLVVAYRDATQIMCDEQLHKARQLLASGESPEAVLESFARSLARKMMHTPTVEMRNAAAAADKNLLDAARILFDLPESGPMDEP